MKEFSVRCPRSGLMASGEVRLRSSGCGAKTKGGEGESDGSYLIMHILVSTVVQATRYAAMPPNSILRMGFPSLPRDGCAK